MICSRSLVLNGTFREFSDGFEELGIPKTGSVPLPLFPPSPPQISPFFLSFAKRFQSWLHKEIVCGRKEAGEALCERRFSLLCTFSFFSSLFMLSFHPPVPSASSVFSVPLCYAPLPLQAEIYKRERVFQGRASGSSSNGNNLEDKDAPARKSRLGDAQWWKRGVGRIAEKSCACEIAANCACHRIHREALRVEWGVSDYAILFRGRYSVKYLHFRTFMNGSNVKPAETSKRIRCCILKPKVPSVCN